MNIPNHIAIIMDGNGRWAKKRLMPRALGHKKGAETLDKLVHEADKIGLKYMTVYAFSTENWKRSEDEVSALMKLLRDYIDGYINDKDNNVKLTFIGDFTRLSNDLQKDIDYVQELSKHKTGLNLIVALNYGGRDEIIRGIKKLSQDLKDSKFDISQINEELFVNYLDTKNVPDPELIIRTSGEMRLSNFLTWQSTYSEFYFTDKLWPDFTIDDLLDGISYLNKVDRRFGGRNEV